MKLVLLCHPPTLGSTSMPRFARLIGEGMRNRGHEVTYLTSPHLFGRLPASSRGLKKWLGYVDQFLIFPPRLKKISKEKNTVFVVTDQALGMWVPALGDAPHVVHCHDFLAQRSALGEFPENPTGWTGKKYQALIRRGYRRARNFISVSEKTRSDLGRFLERPPLRNEVVYNPLNYPFVPLEPPEITRRLGRLVPFDAAEGFVLHVGGDQWYKNRRGVLEIYREYCRLEERPLPLLMAGRKPNESLCGLGAEIPHGGQVTFLEGMTDAEIHAAYCGARALLFPSLEEGFGWPIAEAQACGCPVVTTDGTPMKEVGADAAFYITRRPPEEDPGWAASGAEMLHSVLNLPGEGREKVIQKGWRNVLRFRLEDALDRFEQIYAEILAAPRQ